MSIEQQVNNFENKPFKTITLWLIAIIVIGGVGSIVASGMGFFTSAAKVAHQEFSPEAMLRKYEWFKNASASLQKSESNLSAYSLRINSFKSDYEGVKKKDWPRDERQQYNQLQAEYQGMLQMFNATAAGLIPPAHPESGVAPA